MYNVIYKNNNNIYIYPWLAQGCPSQLWHHSPPTPSSKTLKALQHPDSIWGFFVGRYLRPCLDWFKGKMEPEIPTFHRKIASVSGYDFPLSQSIGRSVTSLQYMDDKSYVKFTIYRWVNDEFPRGFPIDCHLWLRERRWRFRNAQFYQWFMDGQFHHWKVRWFSRAN